TKPPGKGTGLGLSICQNILKTLNGSLSFQSEPGVGTTFTVRVPLS
ncbi:MAG: HAMP domain-containing histidine kinase, partial [Desulfobacterales bacterium]|nr:HAMP domain-containing histidine kinase [Desulfobacterales bacterium]